MNNNLWRAGKDLPVTLSKHSQVTLYGNEKVLIAGGYGEAKHGTAVYMYDVAAESFARKADMLVGAHWAKLGVVKHGDQGLQRVVAAGIRMHSAILNAIFVVCRRHKPEWQH